MKRDKHAGTTYALSAFFAVSGMVIALVVALFTVRHLISPNTQSWNAWTTTALAALGGLAILLWLAGGILAFRVHRARRDRVVTFLNAEEREQVLRAVAQFEAGTSGEIGRASCRERV